MGLSEIDDVKIEACRYRPRQIGAVPFRCPRGSVSPCARNPFSIGDLCWLKQAPELRRIALRTRQIVVKKPNHSRCVTKSHTPSFFPASRGLTRPGRAGRLRGLRSKPGSRAERSAVRAYPLCIGRRWRHLKTTLPPPQPSPPKRGEG
jgi:hypothetical protein